MAPYTPQPVTAIDQKPQGDGGVVDRDRPQPLSAQRGHRRFTVALRSLADMPPCNTSAWYPREASREARVFDVGDAPGEYEAVAPAP
jgi:hypothetical protein